MTDLWDNLVKTRGRQCVMNPGISGAELDAETARQIPILREAIRPHLRGCEKTALDYGCGFGRFTAMLANLIDGRAVGYDPSGEMIRAGHGHISVDYVSCPPDQFFHETLKADTTYDLILAFAVLGEPSVPVWTTAGFLSDLLSENGLLVVVEHVVPKPDFSRWWRFRQPGFYEEVFGAHCIDMEEVGKVAQLGDTMTIYAGRFSAGT
jgi:SAM-dependent methyltransferase